LKSDEFSELLLSPGSQTTIDKTRFLLALSSSHNTEEMENLLLETGFVLEETDMNRKNKDIRTATERVNHTDKHFWIHRASEEPLGEEKVNLLKEKVAEKLDWIGPVFHNPNEPGRRGFFCPLPNVLIIQPAMIFKDSNDEFSQILEEYGINEIVGKSKYLGDYRYFTVTNIDTKNAYQIKQKLENEKKRVVREILFEIMPMIVPISRISNDTLYPPTATHPGQWNMEQIRAGGTGTTAWDLSTGNNSVIVAVLDTGCDLTHPDLRFVPGGGINLGTMMPDGAPTGPANEAHGTACAGIIAATFNNAQGIAGVAGECLIMPLAFQMYTSVECAQGINFAVDNGAQVISMSFFFPPTGIPTTEPERFIDPAIMRAYDNNLVMCAATGNHNLSTIDYPARNPLVMACGASDQLDNRQSPASPTQWNVRTGTGSNFGPEISVVAPGIQIPTTDRVGGFGYWNNDYTLFEGTSAATPHLAGLAAMIRSVDPTLTNFQVRAIIERTADKVGTGSYSDVRPNGIWDQGMGFGRINALNALLNPDLEWFREIVFSGSMDIEDEENIGKNEYAYRTFSPEGTTSSIFLGPIKTGPFEPHAEITWVEKMGGEIRVEALLIIDWRRDSSVDVKWDIKLFEGTSEDTSDLDGEESGAFTIPKDKTHDLVVFVRNTDEDDDDSVDFKMKISNNRYRRP
jgi:hypothetical protein